MAGTDFLLQIPTGNTRAQTVEPQKGVQDRAPAAAPAQSFSSLFAQQRATAVNQQQLQQQQQRVTAQGEKQQQAARQAAAKQAAAAQAPKEKPAAPSKARVDVKEEPSKDVKNDSSTKQTTPPAEQSVVADGKALPPEDIEQGDELDNQLIDPLLLMAMQVQPQTFEAELSEPVLDEEASAILEQATVLLSSETEEASPDIAVVLMAEEEPLTQQATDELEAKTVFAATQLEGAEEVDDAVLVSAAGLKPVGAAEDKSSVDKTVLTVSLETTKAANETLLSKAVTPAEGVRADLQARPEPTLANQTVRQVPGPAVAMQQPGWSQQITDKVMWMSSQNLQSAEIKLDPAELGRLDVKVSINQEQTQITFTSAHAGVRDSLESQMYRLREMFAQQGMQNVDVNVADQSHAQQDPRERASGQGQSVGDGDGTDEALQHVSTIREQHDGRLGMVDYYA